MEGSTATAAAAASGGGGATHTSGTANPISAGGGLLHEGHHRVRRRPPPPPRRDLTDLKLAVFEALSHNRSKCSNRRPPICRLWALYRKALRLFLIGELTKPELDAVVLYTLGDENGMCVFVFHVSGATGRFRSQDALR